MAVYTVLLFFFIPETTYNRPAKFNIDLYESVAEYGQTSDDQPHSKHFNSSGVIEKNKNGISGTAEVDLEEQSAEPDRKKT